MVGFHFLKAFVHLIKLKQTITINYKCHAFFLLKHILESGDLPALFLFPFYKIQLYIFFKLIKLLYS